MAWRRVRSWSVHGISSRSWVNFWISYVRRGLMRWSYNPFPTTGMQYTFFALSIIACGGLCLIQVQVHIL
jgi:hypothetical protein